MRVKCTAAALQQCRREIWREESRWGEFCTQDVYRKTQVQNTGVPYEFSQGTPAVNYLVNFADLSTD